MRDIKERFEDKFIPEPNSGCWLWTAAVRKPTEGYGAFYYKGRHHPAHRISYMLYKGGVPGDVHVCHTCDTPECVNPEHLFLGTHTDNMRDKVAKGRFRNGDRNKRVTDDEVEDIRASSETGVALARRYGISQSLISMIRSGDRR
jgi:hypothetical protein